MAKVRQDAWSHEDDLLLAETVLRHIREGSTQLNAFEEVGDELNRTSAACGFRWNAEVRNKYISAIDLAKRQRKEKKRQQSANMKQSMPVKLSNTVPSKRSHSLIMDPELEPNLESEVKDHAPITFEMVIHYLQSIQKDMYDVASLKKQADTLQSENQRLLHRIASLEKELNIEQSRLSTVEEDYKTFIEIMERARKMTVLEDSGSSSSSPTFKMDKNGNLEQITQSNTN